LLSKMLKSKPGADMITSSQFVLTSRYSTTCQRKAPLISNGANATSLEKTTAPGIRSSS
jgi:hypothetical protein